MKRNIFLLLLLCLVLLLSACGQPTAEEPMEEPIMVDETAPIQWQEPALEALVREVLGKPEGEIYPTDLDHIWGVELWGDQHLFFNAEGGGFSMFKDRDGYYNETPVLNRLEYQNPCSFNYFGDGTYTVYGEQFSRGTISSLADFANFRNLRYLHLYANDIEDLSGLSGLDNLIELLLIDNNIQNVLDLAELRQIRTLYLNNNDIQDVSPLFALTQLSELNLYHNALQSIDGIESLVHLKKLSFAYNQIDNLESVATLSALNLLNANGNPIEDLEPIAGLMNLNSLYLAETQVHDLTPIQTITSLEYIDMTNLQVDHIDLAPLALLPNLGMLDVGQTRAALVNLRSLADSSSLTEDGYLVLKPRETIPDEDIAYLRQNMSGCTFDL